MITPPPARSSAGRAAYHVTFDVSGLGVTGFEAGDWLRDQARVDAEIADHRHLMFLVTIGDDDDTIDRLVDAVEGLAASHGPDGKGDGDGRRSSFFVTPAPLSQLRTEQVMRPADAFLGPIEMVPLKESAGRIVAEYVTPYPPGIPTLVPGELITPAIVDYFDQMVAAGAMTEGTTDPSLRQIRVVA